MNIEFTVEDYFKELQLMESQYGQEEDLYPLIYILLQMAECRKKHILEEQYNPLSIRDVHNAQSSSSSNVSKLSKIKKMLTAKLGVPDFAVLDIHSNHFLGCIEIKKISDSLNIEESNILFSQVNNITIEKNMIKYKIDAKNLIQSLEDPNKLKLEEKFKSIEKPFIPEIDNPIIKKLTEDFNGLNSLSSLSKDDINIKYITQYNRLLGTGDRTYGNRSYGVEFPSEASIDDESSITITLQLYGQTIELPITRIQKISQYKYNGNNDWLEKGQIISHLEKFKKVLYTNGKTFYFLTLSKAETEINVKKLADLHSAYESYYNYCNRHISFSNMSPSDLLSATAEWDKLIAGLTAIDWHHAPITKID